QLFRKNHYSHTLKSFISSESFSLKKNKAIATKEVKINTIIMWSRSSLVIGCLLISIINTSAYPQRRSGESPGKPGEKSLRSLDQVTYPDGIRVRNSLRDSYGNPVTYDTLEAIDAKLPSKTSTDPNMFIIPGYASGILAPHEVPTRSSFNGDFSAKASDDRIHFVDPLHNTFQNNDKPSQTTSTTNTFNQTPINIPKPNINLPETPQVPIDDPLNHVLTPPKSNNPSSPSASLQVPTGNYQTVTVSKNLVPPANPSNGVSVFIPRPNLDIPETPIDKSDSPLNQGLLPPTDSAVVKQNTPTFKNPTQDGPLVITEVHFAPKPSNGLLPPKDPSPNDINFQPQQIPTTTAATVNKFSFGTSIIKQDKTQNKYTGSFGGAPGILGNLVPPTQRTQIPVTIVQDPLTTNKQFQAPSPTQNTFTTQKEVGVQKYQGNFGGPPGVLVNDNFADSAGSSTQAQPTYASPTLASPTIENKYTGGFGGASTQQKPAFSLQPPTPQTIAQLPLSINNNNYASSKEKVIEKYTGTFGGSPGVLQAYDNLRN
ncbi:CLUMA_CG011019, isoform A, partial [Clunio marinus]